MGDHVVKVFTYHSSHTPSGTPVIGIVVAPDRETAQKLMLEERTKHMLSQRKSYVPELEELDLTVVRALIQFIE
jgi:hypothetical protein